ncbi:MAG: hypothetical protein K0S10_251 [Rubrobacteraceae bacterium]|jgi:hypothetical protein|nr:hypothetical protein [Rubrobacteraceae bacterium]
MHGWMERMRLMLPPRGWSVPGDAWDPGEVGT